LFFLVFRCATTNENPGEECGLHFASSVRLDALGHYERRKEAAMRNPSVRLLPIGTLSVTLIVVAGCGQPNNGGSTEVGTSTDPLLGETCPGAGAAVGDQQRTTAFVDYVVGSPTSPFDAYPCNGSLLAPLGGLTAPALADLLQGLFASGVCTTSDPTQTTVCSLPAAERVLTCTGLSPVDGLAVKLTASTIDLCWGAGAGAFFQVSQRGFLGDVLSVHMDPEPVTTTQTLSGSNGATADAVYQNSGTPTSVIKWYTNFIYAPNLAAGTPCSQSDLPVDATAYKSILASGNYRRCG
jgi:hypothetical protein